MVRADQDIYYPEFYIIPQILAQKYTRFKKKDATFSHAKLSGIGTIQRIDAIGPENTMLLSNWLVLSSSGKEKISRHNEIHEYIN